MSDTMSFTVVDNNTGEYPDLWEIALKEDWAKGLMYCDMEGFAVQEDGTLILMDECGKHAYCPEGRFSVVPEREGNELLTVEQLRGRVGKPVWLFTLGCDGTPLKRYDIITRITGDSMETLRGENLGLDGCGTRWLAYDREPLGFNRR